MGRRGGGDWEERGDGTSHPLRRQFVSNTNLHNSSNLGTSPVRRATYLVLRPFFASVPAAVDPADPIAKQPNSDHGFTPILCSLSFGAGGGGLKEGQGGIWSNWLLIVTIKI